VQLVVNGVMLYRLNRFYTPTGAGDLHDTGDSVIVTKNKMRGSGKTISLKISSSAGKDLRLIGWATAASAVSVA
jgi:hypothetical protein